MARQRPSTRPPGHRWAAANHHRDDPLAPSQGKVVPDASDRELLARWTSSASRDPKGRAVVGGMARQEHRIDPWVP